MPTVEDGIQSQLRNIEKTYGQTIDALVVVVADSGLAKHTDVVAMLKERYGMTHGAAHRVSLVARDRLNGPASGATDRIAPALDGVYRRLLETITRFGPDVEQSPKKGYVSLRRRKQFAMLQPGARWINVGLILPKHQSTQRLEPAAKWNALFTHRVRVSDAADVDAELEAWLQAAYAAAG